MASTSKRRDASSKTTSGASRTRIALRQVLPVIAPPLVVYLTAAVGRSNRLRGGPESGDRALTAVYLKSDIGVGGAVINEGELFVGGEAVGFEPGHVCVRMDGEPRTCGRRGCLVAEASPLRVLQRAGVMIPRGGSIRDALTELTRRADADDARAADSLTLLGEDLRRSICDLQLLFDPDVIIVGGFWADAFDRLHLDRETDMRVPPPLRRAREAAISGPAVVAAALGDDAVRAGAIAFALESLFADPAAIGALRLSNQELLAGRA